MFFFIFNKLRKNFPPLKADEKYRFDIPTTFNFIVSMKLSNDLYLIH
jgi:hypothetical protein